MTDPDSIFEIVGLLLEAERAQFDVSHTRLVRTHIPPDASGTMAMT